MKFVGVLHDAVLKAVSVPWRLLDRLGQGLPAARSADHKRASGYLEHGRRHYNAKRYDRAEHYFRKAVRADAGYALAHYYLGLVQYKQNLSEEAIASWKRAMASGPGSDAASKAERKIDYVRANMNQVVRDLESNIGAD